VSTADELRFDVAGVPSLPAAVERSDCSRSAASRGTADGVLLIDRREHRTPAAESAKRAGVVTSELHDREGGEAALAPQPTKPGPPRRETLGRSLIFSPIPLFILLLSPLLNIILPPHLHLTSCILSLP
jgi:hypothetical protein